MRASKVPDGAEQLRSAGGELAEEGPNGMAGPWGGFIREASQATRADGAFSQAVRLLPLPFCNMDCDSLVQPLAKAVRERD